MNQRVKTIFEQAQALPAAEREELAELLLATVDAGSGFDAAWADEAARRWAEHKATGEFAIDALDAVEDARKSLKRPS